MKTASIVCIRRGDRFLVVRNRRNPEWYSFPGGMKEPHEGPLECAVRELREETGLHADIAYWIYEARGSVNPEVTVQVFTCAAEGEPVSAEEGCDVRWMTREELLRQGPYAAFYERFLKVVCG